MNLFNFKYKYYKVDEENDENSYIVIFCDYS